jgi:hypothetical protein
MMICALSESRIRRSGREIIQFDIRPVTAGLKAPPLRGDGFIGNHSAGHRDSQILNSWW